MAEQYQYTLYTYFRSSCSARIRIAALLKGISLDYKFIHLVKGEQLTREYKTHNPSASVPTLIVTDVKSGKTAATIRQSPAILEYFEEARPDLPRLLPPPDDPVGRARVRELFDIIACDIQPVTNLRVLNFIKPLDVEAKDWQRHFMSLGLRAYEELLKQYSGKYSVGDEVSMADCALTPAIDNALRFGVDVKTEFPQTWKVWENLKVIEAFQKGRWNCQDDTPDELKGKE
ncbi:maleylacetoacetate isomerase [Exophiala oligosperma]|uniref:Maleylacetoacetate isomerase n=2 Tax=Chaetothyriales TaxID=34395 RepID=A0A0D2EDJ5_9EURO|nr:maleylacetoacetate isomerase [Exophiala oligosperma]KAJ9612665.1 hypothetical protein H2204_015039 [Knufia peltigerae]KIW45984.1 maleylacetoacetate isomerase [Exophiala oligosperma]